MNIMTYNEALDYIHSLGNFGLAAGLDRIKSVLCKLGNPQDNIKAIHIAGTNGKGSVSAMISSVLRKSGYKTGLFISPYIIDFKERIQINGEFISESDLVSFAQRVISTEVKLTEFEFITALAFLYFSEKEIDVLVCETGLGGRYDATNTLDNLLCAVITKVGLDHTAILGDTIEEITKEKCGILRDAPTVTTPYQDKRALKIIKEQAKKLVIPDGNNISIIKSDISGNTFIYKGNEYKTTLCGEYQTENAVTAIEAISSSGLDISYQDLYNGINDARFPARMELVSDNPLIIIDGAHNPDGAEVLSKELKKLGGNVTAVIGVMKDKNYKEVLSLTLPHCKNAVAVAVENLPRSLSSDELLEAASEFCPCIKEQCYEYAIKKAIEISDGNPIFIFGSLYLAADIRKFFK